MTISECIDILFDHGVSGVTIGKPPAQPSNPAFFLKSEQGIQTGSGGSQIIVGHQVTGDTVGECFERLVKQVDAISKLKSTGKGPILTPNGRRE